MKKDPQCLRFDGQCDCQIILWCKKYEWTLTMKKQEAEIVDLEEARQAKASGSGGGFNHFPGMKEGTVFCCISNGDSGSLLEEYMLCNKNGHTVMLQNVDGKLERHLHDRFWKRNTMVQIMHIPPEKEEESDGTSA